MVNLLSGLGKYGIEEDAINQLFKEDNNSRNEQENAELKKEIVHEETEYLLLRTMECPICAKKFRAICVKSARAKRKGSDLDLRPQFEYIDTNKYDVASCPRCGYTALHRQFSYLSSVQKKQIMTELCNKLRQAPSEELTELRAYSYEEAIEMMKVALYATVIKGGANSEKAYECLKIAWLLRGKIEELSVDKEKNDEAILQAEKEYNTFYKQAFSGFVKAMETESYPMCGMDPDTTDFLIAAMAFNLGKYEYSSKLVRNLLISKNASKRVKDRARDLKEKIIEKIRDGK